jgi:preprotein translocase subunit YajC
MPSVYQVSLFAMASAPGQPAGWIQFLPFAIILGIFYFLILMPMNRRKKKIEEFQSGLKVGDRIVTTSGMYGQITKVNDNSVQVQVAEKVRIEFARQAIGGYQGQEPVVPDSGTV